MSEACEARHGALTDRVDRLEERLDRIDNTVRSQGEAISALKVQVALSAAVGAVLGGGIVGAILNAIK